MQKEAAAHTVQQLMAAARYRDRRDLLQAVLDEKQAYTLEQAEKAIRDFMERQVN